MECFRHHVCLYQNVQQNFGLECEMSYSLRIGVSNAIIVVALVSGFLLATRDFTTFVIFGPSEQIVFAGFVIDTWARWTSVMVFSIVSQISICINVNTLEPFITNVVRQKNVVQRNVSFDRSAEDVIRLDFGHSKHEFMGHSAGSVSFGRFADRFGDDSLHDTPISAPEEGKHTVGQWYVIYLRTLVMEV